MTLSLRPDARGGLRSMGKWSNTGRGWSNLHQHLDVLEPSMSPLFYNSHAFQSTQSMFPQLMGPGEPQALVQAFAQANADSRDTLLKSSNSSSVAQETSSTSDDDCTAPEIHMNCISSLGGGPVMAILQANMLDCPESTGATGATLMAKEDAFPMHHPAETSLGDCLSPCALSDDSLHGADACTTVMAGLKRHLEAGDADWMEQVHGRKAQKGQQQCEKAVVFQDSVRVYAEFDAAPRSSAGVTVTYNADPAAQIISSAMPFLPSSNAVGGSSRVDMDSMRSILFRHASQPVPSLEEIASTRPKRRNVRISKDPQSVAARHRRERISDRIRILQRLVPGGTKMDTASMLDEAIHYVKFLKLQLQTLEQIGNDISNCDQQGNFHAQPQAGAGGVPSQLLRPFDLNRAAAFQAWPVINKNHDNLLEAAPSPQAGHSTQWASTAAM